MIFEVVDPGFPAWGWWFAAGLIVVVTALVLLDVFVIRHGGLAAVSVIGGVLLCAVAVGSVAPADYDRQYDLQIAQGVESHGFENVDLTGRDFTASLDGEYYKGHVIEIETDVFQIVQIVPEEGVK